MKHLAIMFVPLMFMLAMPMQASEPDPSKGLEVRAVELIEQLRDGDFDAPQVAFDSTMREALPPQRLAQTWRSILAQAGALESIKATGSSAQDAYRVAHIHCRFERMQLVADVVFNAEEAVAGLFFRPAAGDSDQP